MLEAAILIPIGVMFVMVIAAMLAIAVLPAVR